MPEELVALDVKTTFSAVPHGTNTETARKSGLPGRTMMFIRSVLEDRSQEIAIGKYNSTRRNKKIGVLQESALSYVLFNLVVRELRKHLRHQEVMKRIFYGDDVIFCATKGALNQET